MRLVQAGQFSFEEGKTTGNDAAALPSNNEIFSQLGTAASPSSSKNDLSVAARIALEDALTKHIGPMAGIVCRKVLAQASDLGEAIAMMKARIPDPARAEQFERNVMSRTLV